MFKFFKERIQGLFKKSKELEREIEKEQIEKETKEKESEKEKLEKPEKEKKEDFFAKLKKKLMSFKLGEDKFDKFFDELENIMIENNVAMEAIDSLRKKLKKELVGKKIKKGQLENEIKNALKKALEEILLEPFDLASKVKEHVKEAKPYVIVFFGINGSGKTTSIAKLVNYFKKYGITCVLAAADTFRAASIEQLEKHASKLQVTIIKHKYGADPAAVAFDAISHAKSKGIDVVLVDTAGRMHTKANLLKEMEKICRVTKPNLKIFVAEATTGNDAVEQAKKFNEATGIDAIILAKADVDEKGGATISVSEVTSKPILFLGTGQEYSDLEVFQKEKIVKNLGL